MSRQLTSEVIVYHDETMQGKMRGHALFFVPERVVASYSEADFFGGVEERFPRRELYSRIMDARLRHGANHKFHFTDISGATWRKENAAERDSILLAIDAMRCTRQVLFRHPLFCKLAVILYPNPTPASLLLYAAEDKKEGKLRFDETLFRMLLKGAVHSLYGEEHHVHVRAIVTDGLPNHRVLSDDRILWRLVWDDMIGKSALRNYVTLSDDCAIRHLTSNHGDYAEGAADHIDAHMLQLTDMLLGSALCACNKDLSPISRTPEVGRGVKAKKHILAQPVKEMLDKRRRGMGFRHSGHYRTFSLSNATIDNGRWEFADLMTKEITVDPNAGSLALSELTCA